MGIEKWMNEHILNSDKILKNWAKYPGPNHSNQRNKDKKIVTALHTHTVTCDIIPR